MTCGYRSVSIVSNVVFLRHYLSPTPSNHILSRYPSLLTPTFFHLPTNLAYCQYDNTARWNTSCIGFEGSELIDSDYFQFDSSISVSSFCFSLCLVRFVRPPARFFIYIRGVGCRLVALFPSCKPAGRRTQTLKMDYIGMRSLLSVCEFFSL
jgi:hypothetical protein